MLGLLLYLLHTPLFEAHNCNWLKATCDRVTIHLLFIVVSLWLDVRIWEMASQINMVCHYYGTVSEKISSRLQVTKKPIWLNRNKFRTVYATNFLLLLLYTTTFLYGSLRLVIYTCWWDEFRYPIGSNTTTSSGRSVQIAPNSECKKRGPVFPAPLLHATPVPFTINLDNFFVPPIVSHSSPY